MTNDKLLAELGHLRDIARVFGQDQRARAFERAMATIAAAPPITRANLPACADMTGIGSSIYAKIAEFTTTGHIDEVTKHRAIIDLGQITGIGPAAIRRFIADGITTIPQLRAAVAAGRVKLTHMQKCGLRHYRDLRQKIPRPEVTKIGSDIYHLIKKIDPKTLFTIAGSYRRDAQASGDVDIIVSNRTEFHADLLAQLAALLEHQANYVDVLSLGRERFTFLWRAERVRQVDVLNLSYEKYWSGVLYFTGSGPFNEAMRAWAKSKDYLLNQNGLFRNRRNPQRIAVRSERDIFDALGLRYVEPAKRNSLQIKDEQ